MAASDVSANAALRCESRPKSGRDGPPTLGVRTWRRGPMAGDGALTAREREIASLVAAGASNPQIAQKLFLSRKTVERHVSNILRKIGAKNRTELASRLRVEGADAPDAGAHR